MANRRTLIRNSVVITVDEELGDFEKGDVLIENELVAAVGPNLDIEDAHVIDGSGMIVLPGLVDTHRHTWQSVLRGIASDWTLGQYFERIRAGLPAAYRPQDVYAANLIGAMEALDSGITTMLDWSHIMNSTEHADAAIGALDDAGLRRSSLTGPPATRPPNGTSKARCGIQTTFTGCAKIGWQPTTGSSPWQWRYAVRIL